MTLWVSLQTGMLTNVLNQLLWQTRVIATTGYSSVCTPCDLVNENDLVAEIQIRLTFVCSYFFFQVRHMIAPWLFHLMTPRVNQCLIAGTRQKCSALPLTQNMWPVFNHPTFRQSWKPKTVVKTDGVYTLLRFAHAIILYEAWSQRLYLQTHMHPHTLWPASVPTENVRLGCLAICLVQMRYNSRQLTSQTMGIIFFHGWVNACRTQIHPDCRLRIWWRS